MIFVRRDPSLIPEKVFRVAERAQLTLDTLPHDQWESFIKKKSHIWRSFSKYLSKMSFGKCWYSESKDAQSFFDVDHFKPKLEAQRSELIIDGGYPWLAFSWENFRFSAQRSNRVSKDEVTEDLVGKGSWFPLLEGSFKASIDNRNIVEDPVLLDPVVRGDVDLIDVDVVKKVGHMTYSTICIGARKKHRVAESIRIYGLDLPRLVAARKRVMREVNDLFESMQKNIDLGLRHDEVADEVDVTILINLLRQKTHANAPYSKAARAQLFNIGGAVFCALPEDPPDED